MMDCGREGGEVEREREGEKGEIHPIFDRMTFGTLCVTVFSCLCNDMLTQYSTPAAQIIAVNMKNKMC